MKTLSISTTKSKEVIDITDKIQKVVSDKDFQSGVVNLFLKHTSAALSTADLDPGTDQDYIKAAQGTIPKLDFNHPHDPSHFPDHFLSTQIGTSLTVPIENGEIILGTWQRIVLLEFNGPKEREIVVNFIKE